MHKYTLAPESTASRNSQNKPPCDVEKIEFERLERNNEFQLGRAPLRWTRQTNTGLPAFLLKTEKMKSQQESRERKNPAETRCRGCAGTRGRGAAAHVQGPEPLSGTAVRERSGEVRN